MSYNIDTWTTIECSLTAPAAALDSEHLDDVDYGKPGASTDVFLSFGSDDEGIVGTLTGDVLTITKFEMRSEGSGRDFHDRALPWLELTRGTLRAVLIWEGGDSVTLLEAIDGVVSDESLDIVALVKENAELKRQIAEAS